MVNWEEAMAKTHRHQLFLCASFRLGKYGSHLGCVGCSSPLYKVGVLVVHSTCTLSIVWHDTCVLALTYWHGVRKGVHSVCSILYCLSCSRQVCVYVHPWLGIQHIAHLHESHP